MRATQISSVGARPLQASMLGYHELMFPLAQTLRNIITHQDDRHVVDLRSS